MDTKLKALLQAAGLVTVQLTEANLIKRKAKTKAKPDDTK